MSDRILDVALAVVTIVGVLFLVLIYIAEAFIAIILTFLALMIGAKVIESLHSIWTALFG